MGKAAMCIRMLQVLSTGRVYNKCELADLLGTKERNILEYKKELDEVAYECSYSFLVEATSGRYGGYRLNGNAVIPPLRFSESEKEALIEADRYLTSRNDFMRKKDFQLAMGKVFSTLVMNEIKQEEGASVINRFPLAMSQEEIQFRYDMLKTAIRRKKTVKFTYLTQKNVTKERVFDPYDLIMYNNAWFAIGWLHSGDHSGIFPYKLNRIQNMEMTDQKFCVYSLYNKNDFVDEYGFKKNGEWFHVEFIAHGNYASLVKERIYGKNQVAEPIDDKSTKVSVDMQNKESIRVFILGFGENATVLEPQWLKDDLAEQGERLVEKYQN